MRIVTCDRCGRDATLGVASAQCVALRVKLTADHPVEDVDLCADCSSCLQTVTRDFLRGLEVTVPEVPRAKSEEMEYYCANCSFQASSMLNVVPLSSAKDLGERLDAGDTVPDGECPVCHAFVYQREKAGTPTPPEEPIKDWAIDVTREGLSTRTITVKARHQREAEALALELAPNIPFTESESNYRLAGSPHEITDTWSLEDVLAQCEKLSDEQGLEVLHTVKQDFDANVGINWSVIETTARRLFPKAMGALD